ncbi:MAG: hypothetical protein R3E66_01785 [bacterium]
MIEALFVAVAVLVGGLIYLFVENLKWKTKFLEAQDALENQPKGRIEAKKESPKKESKAEPKAESKADTKADTKTQKELSELKDEVKSLKTKLHDLKSENKDLKEAVENQAKPVVGNDALFDLRQELAAAKAEVSALKAAPKAASKPAPEPKVEVVEAPQDKPAAKVASANTVDADELKALRKKYEGELESQKRELLATISDLKAKLRNTSENMEKQRRRADNNDRAFKITQRQLDAVQERTELLEGELKRHGIVSEEDVAQAALRAAAIAEAEEASERARERAERREAEAAEKAAAAEAAAEKAAAEAAEKAAAEAAEKAAAEAAEKAAAEAAEKAAAEAAEKAAAEAAEKAAAEAAEKAAAEAAEKAAAEAAEKAAAEAAEKAAAEAAEKAAAEAAEKAAAEAAEKAAAEAAEKAAAEAAEKAAAEAAEKAAAEAAAAADATIKHAPVPANVVETAPSDVPDSDDEGGRTEVLSVSAFAAGLPVDDSEPLVATAGPDLDAEPPTTKTAVFGGSAFQNMIDNLPSEADEQDGSKKTAFGMPALSPPEDSDGSVDDAWSDLE